MSLSVFPEALLGEVDSVDSVGEGVGLLFDNDPISESEPAPSNSTEDGGARFLGFWESSTSLGGSSQQLSKHYVHHPIVCITFQST